MIAEKLEEMEKTLVGLQSKPSRALHSFHLRYLPECPDMLCNDLDYVESVLVGNPNHYINTLKPEMRPFYAHSILKKLANQNQVDNLQP